MESKLNYFDLLQMNSHSTIHTVGELQEYILRNRLSPESLAETVNISNMTIRRLLKKPSDTPLPPRYHLALEVHQASHLMTKHFQSATDIQDTESNFHTLMDEIELRGRKTNDPTHVQQACSKLLQENKEFNFCNPIKAPIVIILNSLLSGKLELKLNLLALGSLAYLLDPFDYIPDAFLGVGLLDDYSVLSLIAALVAPSVTKTLSETIGPE